MPTGFYVALVGVTAHHHHPEALGPDKWILISRRHPWKRLHTGWDGAVINAELVIDGLKQLGSNPLAPFLRAR